MRMILVGAMVAAVAMVGPASGGVAVADDNSRPAGGMVNYANPSGQVIVEREHGAGAEFGLAVASSVLSVLYTPFRFVYGVVGAELGGVGGWTTGGDMRTAKGIWRPTTEGHYFMRPDYLDGTERFRFSGAVPAVREQRVRIEAAEVRAATEPVPAEATVPAPVDTDEPIADEPL